MSSFAYNHALTWSAKGCFRDPIYNVWCDWMRNDMNIPFSVFRPQERLIRALGWHRAGHGRDQGVCAASS